MTTPKPPELSPPPARRLRVYAFDPHASLELGTAKFSHALISLPWNDPSDGKLEAGPVNDYLEVIDVDPISGQFYAPIDLDAPQVLAQDGLPPSEGDPRFHQQMVFAVVMKTIKTFERALGRKVMWRPVWVEKPKKGSDASAISQPAGEPVKPPPTNTYVATQKLRVYPHALREANAYYSREKRALLFGYFNSTERAAGARWIFTALSHDIIVHETTHAILDGLHRRYSEPTSEDSLAFHEAFADIAALFSHFQLYEAVHDYIAKNGGKLDESSLLSGLAGQFAKGTTGNRSLREFVGTPPDPSLLDGTLEAHERGAILVAAVFDAFLSIYSARTADLMRLGSVRVGAAQERLHPDLSARLAKEAMRAADHVLRMCIRALDYLPPVDVRFGEFLRGIITADADLIPDDTLNYRLAFVEAFRARGIFAENCLSMSPDNLLWERPDDPNGYLSTDDIVDANLNLTPEYDRTKIAATAELNRKKIWYWLIQPDVSVGRASKGESEDDRERRETETAALKALLSRARAAFSEDGANAGLPISANEFVENSRDQLGSLGIERGVISEVVAKLNADGDHFDKWEALLDAIKPNMSRITFNTDVDQAWEGALGVFFQRREHSDLFTISDGPHGLPVEVHSVRTTRRAGPDGQDIRQLVIEVTQRRSGYFSRADQTKYDAMPEAARLAERKAVEAAAAAAGTEPAPPPPTFVFRGGATLIIDLRDNTLRYVIRKSINDNTRLDAQRQFLLDADEGDTAFTYNRGQANEPFALLHRH